MDIWLWVMWGMAAAYTGWAFMSTERFPCERYYAMLSVGYFAMAVLALAIARSQGRFIMELASVLWGIYGIGAFGLAWQARRRARRKKPLIS